MKWKACMSWTGIIFGAITSTLFGLELAFNVYAVPLKQTFNFTQTEVELVSVSGVVGMGASLIEPFITARFGYTVGYLVIWVTTSGSALLMWMAAVYKDIFSYWPSVVCAIQFLMNASQNAGSSRLTTTTMNRVSDGHTGKVVGLGLAAVGGGKLVYGALYQFVLANNLQEFFLAVFLCQTIFFGICFVIHRPKMDDRHNESEYDPEEVIPINPKSIQSDSRNVQLDRNGNPIEQENYRVNLDCVQLKSSGQCKTNADENHIWPNLEKMPTDPEEMRVNLPRIHDEQNAIQRNQDNIQSNSQTTYSSTERKILPDSSSSSLKPEKISADPEKQQSASSDDTENPVSTMIKSKYFHLTFWPSAVIYSVLFTYMNNITSIAYSLGEQELMYNVYVLSVTIVLGRLSFGLLFDRFKSNLCGYLLLLTGSLSTATGILLLLLNLGSISLYAVAFLFGVGVSVGLTIPSSMLAVRFGQHNIAYIIGSLYCFTAAFCLLFQFFTGVIYDGDKSADGFCYGPHCFFLSSVLLLAAISMSIIVHAISFVIHYKR